MAKTRRFVWLCRGRASALVALGQEICWLHSAGMKKGGSRGGASLALSN